MSEELIIVIAWEQLHKALCAFRKTVGPNVPITQINFDNIVLQANSGMEKACPGCVIEPLDFERYLQHGAIQVRKTETLGQLSPEYLIAG